MTFQGTIVRSDDPTQSSAISHHQSSEKCNRLGRTIFHSNWSGHDSYKGFLFQDFSLGFFFRIIPFSNPCFKSYLHFPSLESPVFQTAALICIPSSQIHPLPNPFANPFFFQTLFQTLFSSKSLSLPRPFPNPLLFHALFQKPTLFQSLQVRSILLITLYLVSCIKINKHPNMYSNLAQYQTAI